MKNKLLSIALFAFLTAASFFLGCKLKYYNHANFRQDRLALLKKIESTQAARHLLVGNQNILAQQENGHLYDYIPFERKKSQYTVEAKKKNHFVQRVGSKLTNINKEPSITSKGMHRYESLVHPGMLVHHKPRRIAIYGDGDISVLREVLKHKTVEYVAMIKIKEASGGETKESLPCTDLDAEPLVRNHGCRVELFNRVSFERLFFSDNTCNNETDDVCAFSDPFDVIIVKASDPEHVLPLEKDQPKDNGFIHSIYDSLSDSGVLIYSLGDSPFHSDSISDEASTNRESIINFILKSDVESMHLYEESHGKFQRPQSYIVACKNFSNVAMWHANEAVVNVEVRRRMLRTESGLPILKSFDGATMATFQRPSKAWETLFCRRTPIPFECKSMNGFDPVRLNVSADKFEVKISSLGENVGRGLFTTVDIPKGSYIMQETRVHSVKFVPLTILVIDQTMEKIPWAYELEKVVSYLDGYSMDSIQLGDIGYFVDSGISTFTNHGCNGTYTNIPISLEPRADYFSEFVANASTPSNDVSIYNPVVDRRLEHRFSHTQNTVRDVRKGEELFENYLYFTEDALEWANDVKALKAQCMGKEIGSVVMVDRGMSRQIS